MRSKIIRVKSPKSMLHFHIYAIQHCIVSFWILYQSVISVNKCIPKGCYTFTVFDSNGDGMCCGFGGGGCSLTVDGEMVIRAGGEFSTEDVGTFGTCTKSQAAKPEPSEFWQQPGSLLFIIYICPKN